MAPTMCMLASLAAYHRTGCGAGWYEAHDMSGKGCERDLYSLELTHSSQSPRDNSHDLVSHHVAAAGRVEVDG